MKSHNHHYNLLVPRSKSSAKVKVKMSKSHFSKYGRFHGISVSQTHLVLPSFDDFFRKMQDRIDYSRKLIDSMVFSTLNQLFPVISAPSKLFWSSFY